MITTYHNISFGTQTVPEQIPVVQGDTGREIVFILTDFTIPAGATATYYVQKPSGHAVYNAAEITDGKIICNLTAQALAEVGENKLQVRVIKDEEVVTSFTAWLLVHPFEGEGAVESGTEMNIFDQAVKAAEEAIETAGAEATEAIETAGAEATEAIERAGAAAAAEVAEGIDPTLTISGKAADAKATGDAINDLMADLTQKANIDGAYEGMTVGNAEQLVSTQYTEDKVPYLFRTSGGSADIGNREEDMIVGGTVCWNQLEKITNIATPSYNGLTIERVNDYTIRVSGTVVDGPWQARINYLPNARINGHVYFNRMEPNDGKMRPNSVMVKNSTNEAFIGIASIGTDFGTGQEYHLNLFDLTQMFGSTIADYIYSLEQSTAGAGVAWFKKLFPKDYYEYNAGELISVSGLQSHDMVGFNQWDEEWEQGGIDTNTGGNETSTTRIRSKGYIHILPDVTYYATAPATFYLFFYDADKNYIGYHGTTMKNKTFVPSELTNNKSGGGSFANACYMRFRCDTATYANDICINLSWSGYRNGEYEPYTKHSYPLDSTLTLSGIPKLDASGNLYYDGDEYSADGTVTRKYGIVDLGTCDWARLSTNVEGKYRFSMGNITNLIKKPSSLDTIAGIISSRYSSVSGGTPVLATTTGIGVHTNGNVLIYDESLSTVDAAAFKTAMSGVMLVYELATPTTESAAPYQTPQVVDDFGTEEYVTDSIVSVGHVTQYMANLRDKLQHLPDLADSDGYYVIQQTGSQMDLVHFRIPQAPVENGTYILKATVSGGTPTYTWEAES